ncbi:hypothetical protein [Leptolyngbya ohadii]|nr:hypothetical protein [Leptolyngbya ohadii]
MHTPIRHISSKSYSTSFLIDLLTLILAVVIWWLLIAPIAV